MKRLKAKPLVTIHQPKGRRPQLVYMDGGKQVRVSAKSSDPVLVEEERRDLEHRLHSGTTKTAPGPTRGKLLWANFIAQYTTCHLDTLRPKSKAAAIVRLEVCRRIARPTFLLDMLERPRLDRLVSGLRTGHGRYSQAEKDKGKEIEVLKPRSMFTVRSTITQLLSALRWAWRRGLIDSVPPIDPIRVAKIRAMRGRPITKEEFERLLQEVPAIVKRPVEGKDPKPEVIEREKRRIASWRFILRGLWTSGLRVGELMAVSWDDPTAIVPSLGRLSTLTIPASRQKNATEEEIPCLPEFAALLSEVPKDQRTGWVFRPETYKPMTDRVLTDWVSKVVARIGKKAGVVVIKSPLKFASSHDLRRSVAQRMIDAGVSMYTVQTVMRHADFKTTQRHYGGQSVARAADELKELMAPKHTEPTHTVREPSS